MKRFIFAILLLSSFSFIAMPGTAQAKHHRRHRVARVVDRTAVPRSYGTMSVNGNSIVQPSDCDLQCSLSSNSTSMSTSAASNSDAVMCPSLDPSLCNVTSAVVMPSTSYPYYALSPDTNANIYYHSYVPPSKVTVGGFDVNVVGNPYYFSLFKHRSEPMMLHNHKGEDQTAGFGISPRAGSLPESIGGTAYSATVKEQ